MTDKPDIHHCDCAEPNGFTHCYRCGWPIKNAPEAAVCEHGGLRRKCETCDLRAERDRYREALEQITMERSTVVARMLARGALDG